MRHLCGLLLVLSSGCLLSAQSPLKFEREYRLLAEEVPLTAHTFVTAGLPQAKIRWYGEQSQDGLSIEAKAKQAGIRYSIEFDTLGQVEDVEVLTSFTDLPATVQDSICHQLIEEYSRFRLIRIQRQWTATDPGTLQALIQSGHSTQPYHERYEIVLRAKTASGTEWFEYLFGETGEILRKQRLVFRNTDNLDY